MWRGARDGRQRRLARLDAIHGETAWVTPPGDAAALADGIEALLLDEPRRGAIAAAGERFVRRFDWDRGAEILEGHLERYLADPESLCTPPATPVE